MFKKLANAAQSLKEKADDLAEKVETKMQFAADKYEVGKEGATTLFEQHWPSIERVLVEGLLTVAEEKLKDDKPLESTFLKVYQGKKPVLDTHVRGVSQLFEVHSWCPPRNEVDTIVVVQTQAFQDGFAGGLRAVRSLRRFSRSSTCLMHK